eukprot:scaffold52894_cov50-Prasinocladus_malaysianus.AAC.2
MLLAPSGPATLTHICPSPQPPGLVDVIYTARSVRVVPPIPLDVALPTTMRAGHVVTASKQIELRSREGSGPQNLKDVLGVIYERPFCIKMLAQLLHPSPLWRWAAMCSMVMSRVDETVLNSHSPVLVGLGGHVGGCRNRDRDSAPGRRRAHMRDEACQTQLEAMNLPFADLVPFAMKYFAIGPSLELFCPGCCCFREYLLLRLFLCLALRAAQSLFRLSGSIDGEYHGGTLGFLLFFPVPCIPGRRVERLIVGARPDRGPVCARTSLASMFCRSTKAAAVVLA